MPESSHRWLGEIMGITTLAKLADPEFRESINWKWVVGVAGVVIMGLLTIVGFLINAGLNNTLAVVSKIDCKQSELIKNQGDIRLEFLGGLGSIKTELTRIDQKVIDHIEQTDRQHPNGRILK